MARIWRSQNPRYDAYLRSKEWKARCAAVRERCGNICERCGKFKVDEVHHTTYERVYNELLDDLKGLCEACHRLIHEKTAIDPLIPAIHVKVTWRVFEYFDVFAVKHRRFRHNLSYDQRLGGTYQVPIHMFFGEDGKPIFEPVKWQPYRTGYLCGARIIGYGRPDVTPIKTTDDIAKENEWSKKKNGQKETEAQRLITLKDTYFSYKGQELAWAEVAKLFRANRKMIKGGHEYDILDVNISKSGRNAGVRLKIKAPLPKSFFLQTWFQVDRALFDGTLLFDPGRNVWVSTDKYSMPDEPRPDWGDFQL